MTMKDEWYFLDDSEKRQGPFSQSEIINKINTKEISINTLVNSNELKQWIPLNKSVIQPTDYPKNEDNLTKEDCDNEIIITDNIPVTTIPERVGGWLWFFCFSQIVLAPVITLYNIIISQSNIDYSYTPASVISWVFTETFFDIIICGLGIYVGISIFKIKDNAIQNAKYFLILFLGYKFFSAVLPNLFGMPDNVINIVNRESIKDITRGIFTFAIWYIYLNKSERVKRTFKL